MIRGTTPVITLKLPEVINFDTLYVTFTQGTQTVLEKTLDDVTIEGEKIFIPMTQTETLSFNSKLGVNLQLRGKVGDMAYASKIYRIQVGEILKEGAI